MLNIGWGEMAVIAVVALIVIGPKELPNVLRTGVHWMRQVRKMSREFQTGVDSLVREADLEDAKKIVSSAKQGSLKRQIENAIDPTGEMAKSLDPKRIVREAEGDARKPAAIAPAAPPASGAAAATMPAKPSPAVVIGPAVTADLKPASAAVPSDKPADAVPAPTAPVATPADPARKTGS